MQVLSKIDHVWAAVERFVLSITTILMSLMLVGNAISRYFFNRSWAFTEEIGKMGVLVLTFMGLGYAARKRMHIEMSGVFDLLNEKIQKVLKIIINFLSLVILLICTILAFRYVIYLYDLNQVSTILRIPLYLVVSVIPLGFLLVTVQYLVQFFQVILGKEVERSDELM